MADEDCSCVNPLSHLYGLCLRSVPGWQHLDMSLRPCGHHACRTCCQGIAAGRQQFACPFCRTTVVAEVGLRQTEAEGSDRIDYWCATWPDSLTLLLVLPVVLMLL